MDRRFDMTSSFRPLTGNSAFNYIAYAFAQVVKNIPLLNASLGSCNTSVCKVVIVPD